jgi:hypothetical protein
MKKKIVLCMGLLVALGFLISVAVAIPPQNIPGRETTVDIGGTHVLACDCTVPISLPDCYCVIPNY